MLRTLCALAVMATAGLSGISAQAQEISLKTISALQLNTAWGAMFKEYVDYVNRNGKGLVQIPSAMGPEAMPPFEVGNALMSGVIDLGNIPANFVERLIPTSFAASLATLTPTEQRKSGAFDYMNRQMNKKVNGQTLANYGYGIPFYIYTTKPIDGTTLKGMRIRTAPGFEDLVRRLGGDAIQMPPGDVFTALERGIVDGYTWPLWGIDDLGWIKFTKFRVDTGFWNASNRIVVNLDRWKAMSQAQRDFLTQSGLWLEQHTEAFIKERNAIELKKQADAGVKPIVLAPDVAAQFLKTAEEVGWEGQMKKDPAEAPRIRQLLTTK